MQYKWSYKSSDSCHTLVPVPVSYDLLLGPTHQKYATESRVKEMGRGR